eukprot:365738-Chlamydomonas_euryale.AAC.33
MSVRVAEPFNKLSASCWLLLGRQHSTPYHAQTCTLPPQPVRVRHPGPPRSSYTRINAPRCRFWHAASHGAGQSSATRWPREMMLRLAWCVPLLNPRAPAPSAAAAARLAARPTPPSPPGSTAAAAAVDRSRIAASAHGSAAVAAKNVGAGAAILPAGSGSLQRRRFRRRDTG